jgi:DNA-binding CsgD family transcriptional regulator
MTQRVHDPLAVIETAYRIDVPLEQWLDDVVMAMSRTLGGEARGVSMLFDATRPDWVELANIHTPNLPEWLKPALEQRLDTSDEIQNAIVKVFRRGAFGRLYEVIDPLSPSWGALFRRCSVEQISGVIASDTTFRGCAVAVATRDNKYSNRACYRWRKIGAHLAAGLRLRRRLDSLRTLDLNVTDGAEAVLLTNGKVEHAIGPAAAADARGALQDALARIDAARRQGDDRAVDIWAGLVAGRWSLVEHFERAGRRYFLAYRNDPELARVRALTPRELQVASYASLGHSNKLIAYTLGLAVPTVARYLERARRKLGGKAALDALLALQSLLPGGPEGDPDPPFEH